jgi:hypothetical protein
MGSNSGFVCFELECSINFSQRREVNNLTWSSKFWNCLLVPWKWFLLLTLLWVKLEQYSYWLSHSWSRNGPAFYGTPRFARTIVLATSHHCILLLSTRIHLTHSITLRYILILFSHLHLVSKVPLFFRIFQRRFSILDGKHDEIIIIIIIDHITAYFLHSLGLTLVPEEHRIISCWQIHWN